MSGDTPTLELLDGFTDALRNLARCARLEGNEDVGMAYSWVATSYGPDVARLRADAERLAKALAWEEGEARGLRKQRRGMIEEHVAEVETLADDVSRLTLLKSLPSRGHQIAHVLMDFGDVFDGTQMEPVWAALPGFTRDDIRGAWARLLAEVDDAEVEQLTRERDAEVAVVDRTRKALGGGWGGLDGLALNLLERAETAEQERDDLLRTHVIGDTGTRLYIDGETTVPSHYIEAARRLGFAYLYPEDSTTDAKPDEVTILREWAKTSMITVEEHEENLRVEALDDAKAAAVLAGPTGGDQ